MIAACALAALPSGSNASAPLDAVLDEAMARQFAPSVSIAVVQDARIVYAGAQGAATLEPRATATSETRYPIGELGTLFVAVAAVELGEGAKLSAHPNYDDLASDVEREARMPLPAYLARNVFGPAGMTETSAGAPNKSTMVASGYYEMRGTFADAGDDATAQRPCCNFYSTARDLARFDVALLNGALPNVSIASLRPALQTAHHAGMEVLGQEGTLSGYDANDALIPAQRFAMVVLANSVAFPAPAVLDSILGQFYPQAVAAHAAADARPEPYPAIATLLRQNLAVKSNGLGEIERMTFLSSSSSNGLTEYRYLVEFAHGARQAQLLLDAGSRVVGFWLK